MFQVANINLVGNIGSDPELRQTGGGLAVLNFSVAVNSKRRDEETTAWYRVAVFAAKAETLQPILAKGQAVYVAGRLEPREYEGRNGAGISLDVTAADVIVLTPKGEGRHQDAIDTDAVPF